MSATTPVKILPSTLTKSNRSHKSINQGRNFSNPSYHTSLDLANAYSGMVNTHLLNSIQKNHALSSAERAYKRQILFERLDKTDKKLVRSKSFNINGDKKILSKTTSIKKEKVSKNPEDQETSKSVLIGGAHNMEENQRMQMTQIREILSRKTYRVPQYSQQLQILCAQKQSLQKFIKQLKLKISQQTKLKSKLSLSIAKIMNNRQITHKDYCKTYQQNYHLNTAINTTQKQINFLQQQIKKLNQKNNQTIHHMNEQQNQCKILRKYVEQTKRVLMNQEKDVSKLKNMVTVSFNNMSNNYMNMNLLLSEKALLLGDIDTQHAMNK